MRARSARSATVSSVGSDAVQYANRETDAARVPQDETGRERAIRP
jgi:hypothetical protein